MNTHPKDHDHRAGPKQIKKIEAIGKTGVQLFSEKGYPGTSMDDIARASRLAKGGIYHYFHSKEEILYFICSTCMDFKVRKLEEALVGIEDTVERIRALIFQLIDYYTGNFKSARVVLGESRHLSRRHVKIIEAKRNRFHKIVSDVISAFFDSAPCKRPAASALSLTFLALLDGICLRFDPRDGVKPEDLSQLVLTFFMDAARNPGSVRSSSEREFLVSGWS